MVLLFFLILNFIYEPPVVIPFSYTEPKKIELHTVHNIGHIFIWLFTVYKSHPQYKIGKNVLVVPIITII